MGSDCVPSACICLFTFITFEIIDLFLCTDKTLYWYLRRYYDYWFLIVHGNEEEIYDLSRSPMVTMIVNPWVFKGFNKLETICHLRLQATLMKLKTVLVNLNIIYRGSDDLGIIKNSQVALDSYDRNRDLNVKKNTRQ